MKVFLTGGSSGIGAEFYNHLLTNGYEIFAPLRAELNLNNFNVNNVDLSECDYLILCAGVDTNGRQHFINQQVDDFVNTIEVNLLANMKLVHRYITQRQDKWSKIIVVSSTITDHVWPNFVAYGTSKVALETFILSLEQELPKSIGTCIIRPGLTRTNFHFNRGNVSEQDRNVLYNTMPCMNTDEFIPLFDQILTDHQHLIKEVKLSA